MTVSTIKHSEPLFVVVLRDNQANALLKAWVSQNRVPHAQVHEHRMQLYDHHALSMFMMTWTGSWSNILIWDAWNKRHIDIQNT